MGVSRRIATPVIGGNLYLPYFYWLTKGQAKGKQAPESRWRRTSFKKQHTTSNAFKMVSAWQLLGCLSDMFIGF